MRQPQTPAARAEYGREQPVKKPPQEAVPGKEKWDRRTEKPNPTLIRARQLQNQLEREHGSMATSDPKGAEEAFGDDLRAVEALIPQLINDPSNKDLHAMLNDIWKRRMPQKRN